MIQPWKSVLDSLICQALGRETLLTAFWKCRSRKDPQSISCWLKLESSFLSIRHSFSWHLILTSIALGFCSLFLKILLFRSSHICQHIILGRKDQAALITLFFQAALITLFFWWWAGILAWPFWKEVRNRVWKSEVGIQIVQQISPYLHGKSAINHQMDDTFHFLLAQWTPRGTVESFFLQIFMG